MTLVPLIAVLAALLAATSRAAPEIFASATGSAVKAEARILYSSDWSGYTQIYATAPAAKSTAQLTWPRETDCTSRTSACAFEHASPSPDGRRVAYVGESTSGEGVSLWLARADGRDVTRLEPHGVRVTSIRWRPDSGRLAYEAEDRYNVVRADGSGRRALAPGTKPAWVLPLGSSPDGRWVATVVPAGIEVRSVPLGVVRTITASGARTPVWSPDSRRLAFGAAGGIRVADVRTGRTRRLTRDRAFSLAWSPEGTAVAYIQGDGRKEYNLDSGDLRVVTLAGTVSTLVDKDRAYGGAITSLAWARPAPGVRYRPPDPAPATRVGPLGFLAGGKVSRLAADGRRVAFACGFGVAVWTPADREIRSTGPNAGTSSCKAQTNSVISSVALAGDRLLYAERVGCNVITVTMRLEVLAPPHGNSELARGFGNCGDAYSGGVGYAAGSRDLLVYTTFREQCVHPECLATVVTTSQEVNRVGPTGCPCPAIASSPGPLVAADVEGGRVVAYGDIATLLIDATGALLLSVGASPRAAQLTDSALVLLLPGELRTYDTDSGAIRSAWPLPDVTSGGTCDLQCIRAGSRPRLTLQDAARGLVAYVLDGQVRLLRLQDGADVVVARGGHARFMDSGLVYADGSRLHLVPFDRLPLR